MINKSVWKNKRVSWLVSILGALVVGTLLEYINKFIGDFPIFWITLGIFLLVVLTLYIYDDYKSKKQIEKDVIHIKEGVDRIENHLKK